MKIRSVSVALLSVLGLAIGMAAPAMAQEFKVPAKKPVVTVTYPEAWSPEAEDEGVWGQSADTAVYISVEAAKSEKGVGEIIDASFDMFKEHKVKVDKSTKKENKMTIAGEDATEMLYTGTDEDGPAVISLTLLQVKDTVIVITYWASTDKEAKYAPIIGKIVNSIKKVE